MKEEKINIDILDELLRQHLMLNKESNLAEQVFNREVSYNPSPRKIKDFIGKMDKKTKYLGNTNFLKLKHILHNKAFISIVFTISLTGIFLVVKNKPDKIISESGLNSQDFLHSNNKAVINDLTNTFQFHLKDTGLHYKVENDCLLAEQSDESTSVLSTTINYSVDSLRINTKFSQKIKKSVLQDSINVSVDSISLYEDKTKNLFIIDTNEKANTEKKDTGYNDVNKASSQGEFYLFFISKNQTKLSVRSVNTLDTISQLMIKYPKTELIIVERDKNRRKVLTKRIYNIKQHLFQYKIYSSRIEFKLTANHNKERKGTQYKREKYFKLKSNNQSNNTIVLYLANSISAD